MTWIDSRKEYDRARYLKRKPLLQKLYQENREERLSWQKEYNLAHKEERALYDKNWRQNNREHIDKYLRKYLRENPKAQIRSRAHNAVGSAIRKGELLRGKCEICESKEVEAHHDSYLEKDWLNVRWLCKKHHEEWHMKSKGGEKYDLDEL